MKDIIKNIEKKNLIIIGGILIAIIVLIIGGSLIYNNFFYKKTYQEIENIMVNAASNYYNSHPKELPANNGETINIEVSKLVSSEYMKPISEYLKDKNSTCKGSVNVTNVNSQYRYIALLDCDKDYTYKTLTNYIKENEPIVTNGNGLYELNNELVYRGEKINNYVNFANSSWRIIKITDNKVMLIYNDKLERTTWDDRYNTEKNSNVGINDFNVSRIKDYLTELYTNNTFLDTKDKLLLSNFSIPTGKRSEEDNDKSGTLEKTTMTENQYIGLLPIYDYINASIDNNCNNAISPSCTNYNYILEYEYNFWSITTDNQTSYYVFQISSNEGAYLSRASSNSYIRPVILITSDAIYVDGNGTIDKPYTFK